MLCLSAIRLISLLLWLQDDPATQAVSARLHSFLHLLYILCAVLVVVLIAAVALAIRAYRKSRSSELDQ